MTIQMFYALAVIVAAGVALFATPRVRRMAHQIGVTTAGGERDMHSTPTPRIGGIAVYLGFVSALFVVFGIATGTRIYFHHIADVHALLGLLFGGTLIMLVGVWDDVMGMRPRMKFLAQIFVALVSMGYGFTIDGFDIPIGLGRESYVNLPWYVDYPITLVFYLGMMNAINFLDGLDGLLSGVTAITGLFLAAIALAHGHALAALVLFALVGGALGFLPYNFNPATIFLGDTGSLFIGYVFATVSIIITAKIAIAVSLLVPLVALALPVIDTAHVILRRASTGKAITEADRGHFHHILIFRFGLNVKQAVLLLYAMSAVLGVVAYFLSSGPHVKFPGAI